jgi:hypothetical protein
VDRKGVTDRTRWSVIVDSLPRERRFTTSFAFSAAEIYCVGVFMPGYFKTRHNIRTSFVILILQTTEATRYMFVCFISNQN